jgi:hypothetical protein
MKSRKHIFSAVNANMANVREFGFDVREAEGTGNR